LLAGDGTAAFVLQLFLVSHPSVDHRLVIGPADHPKPTADRTQFSAPLGVQAGSAGDAPTVIEAAAKVIGDQADRRAVE
jgi:hypothetical protein